MSTVNDAGTAGASVTDVSVTGASVTDARVAGAPAADRPATEPLPATAGSNAGPAADRPAAADGASLARVWRNLNSLVREQNEGRKKIVEALGMSFFRAKALRRIAVRPSRMSELATELASDRPYLTLVVDDLEKRGLVERRQHPTDRRCKIVSVTAAGQAAADRANEILGTPPPALAALPSDDLATLDRILARLAEDAAAPARPAGE